MRIYILKPRVSYPLYICLRTEYGTCAEAPMIDSVFAGRLVSIVTCRQCRKVSLLSIYYFSYLTPWLVFNKYLERALDMRL